MTPEQTEELGKQLLGGRAPKGLKVRGSVDLSGVKLRSIPANFEVAGDLSFGYANRLQRIGSGLKVEGCLSIGTARSRRRRHPPSGSVPNQDRQCYIKALPGLRASRLQLAHCAALERLPDGLVMQSLELTACDALRELPPNMVLRSLTIKGCRNLRRLPANLTVVTLTLVNAAIEEIPADLKVDALSISGCRRLHSLPPAMSCGSLTLRHLTKLREVPALVADGCDSVKLDSLPGIETLTRPMCARVIEVIHCPNLTQFTPETLRVGRLTFTHCAKLERLPSHLTAQHLAVQHCAAVHQLPSPLVLTVGDDQPHGMCLDVMGSRNVTAFPAEYKFLGAVRIDGSGLQAHPPVNTDFLIRYGQTVFPAKLFFTANADTILAQQNAEVRRVLLAHFGLEKVLAETKAQVVDEDRDPGGVRQLLRLPCPGGPDPHIVYLRCQCPSTQRVYLLRVPPKTPSCRAAAAWMAGFNDPNDYHPVLET